MDMRKFFHAIILIKVFISPCPTIGWDDDVHVRMTNNLGPDTVINLHCVNSGKDMGHQEIPYNWTCQWWLTEFIPGKLLCDANMEGATQLTFLAFDGSRDSCADDCHWKFTHGGVFQLIDGTWVFRFNWPH